MPLYKTQSPIAAAQTAMSGATQAAGSMSKEVRQEKDGSFWDDFYKGATGVARVAQGIGGLVNVAQDVTKMYDDYKSRDAYDYIAKKVGSSGDISSLDGDPILDSFHGNMALGRYTTDRVNNQQSRLAMLQSMEKTDDMLYQNTFRPLAMAAQEAYQKGDMRTFGAIASELSAKSPFPYQCQTDGDGNFTVSFRSTKDGGYVQTGQRLSPQQVMETINGVMAGEQKVLSGLDMQTRTVNLNFTAASARYRLGTVLSNAKAMEDPNQWIPLEKNGKVVYAIPQNRHDDYSAGPSYRIVDGKGGKSSMAGSLQELLDQGYVRSDVAANTRKLQAAGRPSGGYTPSQRDLSILEDYATVKDENGEKVTDHTKAAILEALMRKTGLTAFAARSAYEDNIKAAMQAAEKKNAKISREQAEKIVQDAFVKQFGGRVQSPPSNNTPSSAPGQGQDEGTKRINETLGNDGQTSPKEAAGLAGNYPNGNNPQGTTPVPPPAAGSNPQGATSKKEWYQMRGDEMIGSLRDSDAAARRKIVPRDGSEPRIGPLQIVTPERRW